MTSTSSTNKKKYLQEVVSKYYYTYDSDIGHGINGTFPKPVKRPKFSDLFQEIVLITFFLLEVLEIKYQRIATIHFDKNEPDWFQLLFKVTNFSKVQQLQTT